MKKVITLLLVLFIATGVIFAQDQKPAVYSMVELRVELKKVPELQTLGLPLDCCYCSYDKGTCCFIVPLTAREIEELAKKKFVYSILIEDAAKYYAARSSKADYEQAQNYRSTLRTEMQLGSMGGFYTVEEAYQKLDELYQKYGKDKKLISVRKSIGKSFEKRDIYVVKISDNADQDEENEPQVLYTALTHAREPGGMMAVFYFMYYLLENYETDSRVRSIVDNRELYFIPIVNPDGYAYNQKTNPSGGGMRRKNNNGVDLNRNFGPDELWDYPNGGSSTSSWSQTYRGTAAFSEPETAALRDFARTKKFRAAINYHTYSNLLIYPWGIKNEVAHPMFETMAKEMTRINGYRYGTAPGLLYAVRGDSDDWFYEELGVFALTPEVGGRSDGFWPSSSRIFPLAKENLEANLLLAEYAAQLPQK